MRIGDFWRPVSNLNGTQFFRLQYRTPATTSRIWQHKLYLMASRIIFNWSCSVRMIDLSSVFAVHVYGVRLSVNCGLWTIVHPLDQWYSTGGTRTPVGTRRHLGGYVDYTICISCIMCHQLWGYKGEEKLYLGVREQKRLNATALDDTWVWRATVQWYWQKWADEPGEELAPVPFCSPQIPRGRIWAWTWTSAVIAFY
jgi:hypothetical protein